MKLLRNSHLTGITWYATIFSVKKNSDEKNEKKHNRAYSIRFKAWGFLPLAFGFLLLALRWLTTDNGRI